MTLPSDWHLRISTVSNVINFTTFSVMRTAAWNRIFAEILMSKYLCLDVSLDRYLSNTLKSLINSAGKRDRICVMFSSDKLLVTNRPKAAIIP